MPQKQAWLLTPAPARGRQRWAAAATGSARAGGRKEQEQGWGQGQQVAQAQAAGRRWLTRPVSAMQCEAQVTVACQQAWRRQAAQQRKQLWWQLMHPQPLDRPCLTMASLWLRRCCQASQQKQMQ